MRTVLDTSVIIAGGHEAMAGELAISAITLAELHFGVLATTDPDEKARRLRLLTAVTATFDPLPVDDAVAVAYGELAALTKAAGRQPRTRTMDLLIAATALANGAQLATLNTADVDHLAARLPIVEPHEGGWLVTPDPSFPAFRRFVTGTGEGQA